MESNRIGMILVGAAAVLLQALLSPVLTIGDARPEFPVIATVVLLVVVPEEPHYVFAFVMGLIADLTGYSPVGATSLALLACAFILPMLVEAVGNDNILMSAIIILAGVFAVELVYGLVLACTGVIGLPDALAHIVLPCAVYDAVLGFVFYLVAARLYTGRPNKGGATMSNVRF